MTRQTFNHQTWIPISLIGAVALLAIYHPFLYVTEPGHATVIFNTFSGLQRGRVEKPGVTVISPFVDIPITYTVLTRVWQFTDDPNARNLAGSAISINSADGQAFSLDVSVALKPNRDVLDTLHAEVGENYMNTIVVSLVRSKIRDVSTEFDSEDFYRKDQRAEIEKRSLALINAEMPSTKVGDQVVPLIAVEGIFLGAPKFPTALKDSIEQRQVASITAQTAEVRAQIQTKETERVLILAKANQTAIELKGQAAARNAQLADLLLYEKLQDRIEKAASTGKPSPLNVIRVDGNSTVFLNVDPHQAAIQQP